MSIVHIFKETNKEIYTFKFSKRIYPSTPSTALPCLRYEFVIAQIHNRGKTTPILLRSLFPISYSQKTASQKRQQPSFLNTKSPIPSKSREGERKEIHLTFFSSLQGKLLKIPLSLSRKVIPFCCNRLPFWDYSHP